MPRKEAAAGRPNAGQLTVRKLREALHYSPETGVFTRLHGLGKGGAAGSVSCVHGYMNISIGGKLYRAHRLAWLYMTGAWPKGEIDHLNGKKADNRWENLRDVSHVINMQNQRFAHCKNKSSGILGVSLDPRRNRWSSRICVRGRTFFLGYFNTPDEAQAAYLNAKRSMHQGNTI